MDRRLTVGDAMQVIEMGHLTLLASEISGERARAAGGPIDLPNSSLLSEGYACLAQEGGLTITIEPSQGIYPVC